MNDIFGEETITVSESPQGQEEETAVETEGQEQVEMQQEEQQEEETNEETVEQEETQEESDSEEEESDELIAGKFKTQEDLVKAYKNLERKFHESRQNKNQQQEPQQIPQEYGQDPNDIIWQHLQRDPMGTIQQLVDHAVSGKIAPVQEQLQYENLAKNLDPVAQQYAQVRSEEGMSQLFERVGEIAQELGNPGLVDNPTKRILKMAADELWGETKTQMIQKAKAEGRQEAVETRKQKKSLDVQTGKKPKGQTKTPEEEIAEAIVQAGKSGGLF